MAGKASRSTGSNDRRLSASGTGPTPVGSRSGQRARAGWAAACPGPRTGGHRPVPELRERVHEALRVDHGVDLRVLEPEQVVRLDHLEPLFISVAESIVIFGPICQTGCASASFTEALASSAWVQPLNGPPTRSGSRA